MRPPEKQRPPWGGGQCGTRETTKSQNSAVRVAHFPATRRVRPGILAYRAPRTPGDTCAAIMRALDREARLARDTGKHTPPEVLEGMSAWIGRGCLP